MKKRTQLHREFIELQNGATVDVLEYGMKLIIFDNDGVLVDSEIIGHEINAEKLTALGYPLSVSDSIKLLTGITHDQFEKIMQEKYGKAPDLKDMEKILNLIDHTIEETVKPVDGIIEILN